MLINLNMSTVNLYDVLNISQDCSKKDIKDAYRQLAKEFHPDKATGDAEMFELVTHAYNILSNSKNRQEYDELYKLQKQSNKDHSLLKKQAEDYYEADKTNIIKKTKKERKNEFKKISHEMDKKHKYKRKIDDQALDPKDLEKRLNDIILSREQEDIENIHDKLFEDGQFDIKKFNAAFDNLHKEPLDLVPRGNPNAWNDDGTSETNFSSINNYEDIYLEDDNNNYANVEVNVKKIKKEDLNKVGTAAYYEQHNQIEKDYEEMLKERLSEREHFNKKLDEREFQDFDTNNTCGGYGIFDKLGIKYETLNWVDDEDIETKYKKLLEMRKKEYS